MTTRDVIILDDVFEVLQKDPDGKKFDRGEQHAHCCSPDPDYCQPGPWLAALALSKFIGQCMHWLVRASLHGQLTITTTPACCCCSAAVSRFICRSELYEFDLALDINIDIYPLRVSAQLTGAGGAAAAVD